MADAKTKKISIILFYADWCVHCKKYMSTWDRIRNWCGTEGRDHINVISIDDETFTKLRGSSVSDCAKAGISGVDLDRIPGYPTVCIVCNNEAEYLDNKTEEHVRGRLKHFLNVLANGPNGARIVQTGGGLTYRSRAHGVPPPQPSGELTYPPRGALMVRTGGGTMYPSRGATPMQMSAQYTGYVPGTNYRHKYEKYKQKYMASLAVRK